MRRLALFVGSAALALLVLVQPAGASGVVPTGHVVTNGAVLSIHEVCSLNQPIHITLALNEGAVSGTATKKAPRCGPIASSFDLRIRGDFVAGRAQYNGEDYGNHGGVPLRGTVTLQPGP
jgi:hypothetical protein